MTTISQKPTAATCPETIADVTIPRMKAEVSALYDRLRAEMATPDRLSEDAEHFALRVLAGTYEPLPDDLNEMVLHLAGRATSLTVALGAFA